MESDITFVGNTFSAKAGGFISLFGNITTGQFLKGIISITWILIALIIGLEIWSVCQFLTISAEGTAKRAEFAA